MRVVHLSSSQAFQQSDFLCVASCNAKLLLVEQQPVFLPLFNKLKRDRILVPLVCQDVEKKKSSVSNRLILTIQGSH